jgi:hypothetical protein
MSMRLSAIVFGCLITACGVGGSPDGDGDGKGDGTGGGSGGGSGSGGGGGGGGGSTDTSGVASFLHEMGKKYCDQAFACKASFPTDQGVTFEQAFGASAMACIADADMYNNAPAVAAAITGGTITWNPADATACLAGITFPACAQFWTDGANEPAACATALVGKVADGGACVIDFECANLSSYCDETSKKCTVDTGGMRTVPEPALGLHTQSSVIRR